MSLREQIEQIVDDHFDYALKNKSGEKQKPLQDKLLDLFKTEMESIIGKAEKPEVVTIKEPIPGMPLDSLLIDAVIRNNLKEQQRAELEKRIK